MKDMQEKFKLAEPRIRTGTEDNFSEIRGIDDEDTFSDTYIMDCCIEGQEAAHVCFDGVIMRRVDFRGVTLNGVELTDVRFEDCDLSNADFSGAIIHRTEFIDCKLVGLKLNDATLQNVLVSGCNGRFLMMSYGKLKKVLFRESSFESGSLQSNRFEKVMFENCNLRLCQLSGTSLAGMDLSSSELDGVCIQPENLHGAMVTPMQAVDLSRLLGLVIKE